MVEATDGKGVRQPTGVNALCRITHSLPCAAGAGRDHRPVGQAGRVEGPDDLLDFETRTSTSVTRPHLRSTNGLAREAASSSAPQPLCARARRSQDPKAPCDGALAVT
jgi:hypothetical protein